VKSRGEKRRGEERRERRERRERSAPPGEGGGDHLKSTNFTRATASSDEPAYWDLLDRSSRV
jgi:hypothetical protein